MHTRTSPSKPGDSGPCAPVGKRAVLQFARVRPFANSSKYTSRWLGGSSCHPYLRSQANLAGPASVSSTLYAAMNSQTDTESKPILISIFGRRHLHLSIYFTLQQIS